MRIIVLLILVHLFSNGCSQASRTSKNTLNLYVNTDPLSLDPRMAGDRTSQIFTRELFEGLYRLDEKGIPAPALAKSLVLSEDGCKYIFTLHKSYWSNGNIVTSQDFKYAWTSALSPTFPSRHAYLLFIIKNGQKFKMGQCSEEELGLSTPNDETLIIELEHPAPYFVEFLSNPLFSPICKNVVEQHPDWAARRGDLFVSNGPYILQEHIFKNKLVLEQNIHYWHTVKPKTPILYFNIIEDQQTAFDMFERGDLDWLGEPFGSISPENIPSLIEKGHLHTKNLGAINLIACNTRLPHLSSPKIRKALASVIDRATICKLLLSGGEEPAFSLLPKDLTQATPTFFDNDAAMAQQLFLEGLNELGITKEEFPPLTFSGGLDLQYKSIAQILHDQFAKVLGIKILIQRAEPVVNFNNLFSGNYELLSFNWCSYYSDPMYNLELLKFNTNSINGTGWENQRYIALLDQADQTIDLQERNCILKAAEEIVLNELPIIPFYYLSYKYLKRDTIHGEGLSSIGSMELKYLEKR